MSLGEFLPAGCSHPGDKPLNEKRYCSPCFVRELRRIWYPTDAELKSRSEDPSTQVKERSTAQKRRQTYPRRFSSKPPGISFASIIDPLLFAGGKTVKQIAEALSAQAGATAQGKDLKANVRARLFA